jgi:glycosyltransferase involved in cell wall biosynthesis
MTTISRPGSGISVVTGTLNRRSFLPGLIENTVGGDERIELVLVDGGSNDGSLEYLRELKNPRIRLIEVGHRSSYPHFMNAGVRAATHEWICQWNDDVLLLTPWRKVFDALDESMVYLFAWRKEKKRRFGFHRWNLVNTKKADGSGEIVMNYGIYHKDVFRIIGLYNNAFHFYCADGDMAQRAWHFGYAVKNLPGIHVLCRAGAAKSRNYDITEDWDRYQSFIDRYKQHKLPDVEHLL